MTSSIKNAKIRSNSTFYIFTMQIEKRTQKRRLIPHPTKRTEVMGAEPIERNERKKVVDTYRDIIREAEAARLMVRKAKEQRDAAREAGADEA